MKIITIKRTASLLVIGAVWMSILTFNGCKASQKISAKTGVQLWAENCQRCHNSPPATTFSHEQWETVGMHMQSRALLTEDEKNKIVDFLKQ